MKDVVFSPLVSGVLAGLALTVTAVGTVAYIERGNAARYAEVLEIEARLAAESAQTSARITALEDAILAAVGENGDLATALKNALEESREIGERIEDVTDTVDELEKLSNTDPELLQKYSKVYFLNEHYVPSRLTTLDDEYLYDESRTIKIHTSVRKYLERMLDAAKKDGIDLSVVSGYRSFSEQANLKSGYTVTYGAGTANQFSAEQGYSEHQLGTTVDLTTATVGGTYLSFANTEAYTWLTENAHRYGFTLSYPKGNAYYQYEPWHWRFVGVDLASDLHDDDTYFYDMEQRRIDAYLVELFD